MIRLPGRGIFGPKKTDVQHQTCRYETMFHSVLRSRGERPLSQCITSALPCSPLTRWLTIVCDRVSRRVRAEYELGVAFTLWHGVERWSYVAIGGDDAAKDAPLVCSLLASVRGRSDVRVTMQGATSDKWRSV